MCVHLGMYKMLVIKIIKKFIYAMWHIKYKNTKIQKRERRKST